MHGKHRIIYAYLLILQADMGPITLSPKELAQHMEVDETDVLTVLDIKFDFKPDINAYINRKMNHEVMRAGGILARKTEGAAKARAKKEEREEQNRTDSDISLDISLDINGQQKPKQPNPFQPRLNALFKRRDSTKWSSKELKAFKQLEITEEEMQLVEKFHSTPGAYKRQGLQTLLNNWNEEVDRARNAIDQKPKRSQYEPKPV